MLIPVLFLIGKRWKQPKCPSVHEKTHALWSIHTIDYYSAIKRNKVLIHATTCTNLENMPSQGSRKKKGHILYDSISSEYLEEFDPEKQMNSGGHQGLGMRSNYLMNTG